MNNNGEQAENEVGGATKSSDAATDPPPPVARMPHASLPPPPKKGPHHHSAQQQQQQEPAPSNFYHPGFNLVNFIGNFGLPMMQGTTASTPAAHLAAGSISTPQINQLLALQQQQQGLQQKQQGAKIPRRTLQLVAPPGKKRRGPGRSKKAGGGRGAGSSSSGRGRGRGRGRGSSVSRSSSFRTPRSTILDEDAKRLTNPLVDVPYVEDGTPPQAHDLVVVHNEISFGRNDTFPLSHHARLLGFDIPKTCEVSRHWSNRSIPLDVQGLTLPDKTKDAVYTIPPKGTWYAQASHHGSLLCEDPLYTTLHHQQHLSTLAPTNTIPIMTKELQLQVLAELNCKPEIQSHITATVSLDGSLFTVKLGSVECEYNFSWIPLSARESELVLQVLGVTLHGDLDGNLKKTLLFVISLILQHARSHHVWYGVWNHVPEELSECLQTYFGMSIIENTPTEQQDSDAAATTTSAMAKSLYEAAATMTMDSPQSPTPRGTVMTTAETLGHANFMSTFTLLCDLHQCSTRHAHLLYQQDEKQRPTTAPVLKTRQRLLVRMPTVEQVTGLLSVSKRSTKETKSVVTSAKEAVRGVAFGVRVSPKENDGTKMELLDSDGQVVEETNVASNTTAATTASLAVQESVTAESGSGGTQGKESGTAVLPDTATDVSKHPPPALAAPLPGAATADATKPAASMPPDASAALMLAASSATRADPSQPTSWDVLKSFALVIPDANTRDDDADDEILRDLKAKQSELAALEGSMEPKVRSLMQRVVDERMEYEKNAEKREEERQLVKAYGKILERRKELDTAWLKQREQDADAVCEICRDGEVTPTNQIIFCEACNVAVHQLCYGIEEIPEEDYYCIPCRYLDRDKMAHAISQRGGEARRVAPSPLPICCELCPQKQGAFYRSDASSIRRNNADTSATPASSRWVHVVCAKWQGLNFEPLDQTEVVEDVQELKKDFLLHGVSCILCLGKRGAYNQCLHEGCENWMHITCARESGLCEVTHGQNCHGDVDVNPWSLLCPEHSTIDPATVEDRVSIEQLVRSAAEFPPEPHLERIKERPKKTFNKMMGSERHKFLSDPEYERNLLDELARKLHGVHCEVCHQFEEGGRNLKKCTGCGVVFCASCVLPADIDEDEPEYRCPACKYVDKMEKEGAEYETPQCTMCFQQGGWLREAYAEPVNRKTYWKHHPEEYTKTLFAKDRLWCHAICTMWHPKVTANADGTVDCASIIMTNGMGHILNKVRCSLCGDTRKMKVSCSEEGCRCWGKKRGPYSFHVTCAREAGLEVRDKPDENGRFYFDTKCYQHGGEDYALRARMEDLIEIERRRFGKRFEKSESLVMSLAHASRLYNKAIIVMKMFGWAWRWAEWWVEFGDNWEPLLEPGEKEEDMTKEELKIVDTTRESRCEAARKCRLAAFGAALRNRDYDKEEGDDFVALDRALRAVLHTPELVGPMEEYEIDFFAEWLARVYRSKSRLLGFGKDKIPVKEDYVRLLHAEDKSPKYLLGARRLPGKQELPEGEFFETDFHDVDDFLKPETYEDGSLVTEESLGTKRKRGKDDDDDDDDDDESPGGKRSRRGGRRSKSESGGSPSETLGTSVTLTAVYTTAAVDELSQDEIHEGEGTIAQLQLLPSPVQAVIVDPPLEAKPPGKRRGRKPKKRTKSPKSDVEDVEGSISGDSPEEVTSGRKKAASNRKQSPTGSSNSSEAPKKRLGRPPKSSYASVEPQPKKRGRTSNSSTILEQYSSPRKRMGRPPKIRSPEGAKPKPKGRVGRPPKASKVLEQEDAPVANVTDSMAAASPTTDTSAGNIAERIKRRRGSPEQQARESNESATTSMEPVADPVSENAATSKEVSRPNDEEKGMSETVAQVAESVEETSPCDDDVPLSVFVQRQKEARGEPTSVLVQSGNPKEDSSGTSSGSEQEVPLSEMSPSQRGRKRGKQNAVRDLFGPN